MPALPLDEAGKYVAGAYVVFLALLLIYVAIMAAKLARFERELGDLAELASEHRTEPEAEPEPEGDAKQERDLAAASKPESGT
jgi:hypothetical protein